MARILKKKNFQISFIHSKHSSKSFCSILSLFKKSSLAKNLCYSSSFFLLPLAKRIQRTNCLRILLILPSPSCQKIQGTNRLRYLLFPLTKSHGTNRLRILCLNTLEDTSFVVQVECTSTWVVILRTREGISLVDQFKWSVHPLGCSKRTREGTSLVDLCL